MDASTSTTTNPNATTAANKDSVQQIWDKILSEASQGKESRQETKNLLIVGEPTSNSMQLFSSLKKNYDDEDAKLALDYSYLDVAFEDELHYADDVMARVNVWRLENPEHKDLLTAAINPQNIKNSMVLIALDGSEPWNLLSAITKWMTLITEYLQKTLELISKNDKAALLENVKNLILNYMDPSMKDKAAQNLEKGEKQPIIDEKKLDIPNGVLTTNLGIPIIIVVCKTESFENIEREYRYDDTNFDYIQLRLRNFCLKYGASLVYTSIKEKKNIDLLYRYITHLLLKTDFKESAQTVEKDRVFIPIGWDLLPKINILKEQNKKLPHEDEEYENIIFVPNNIKKKDRTKVFHNTTAEDDQEFLQKLLSKDVSTKDPVKDLKEARVRTFQPTPPVAETKQRSVSLSEAPKEAVPSDVLTTPRDQEPPKQTLTTPANKEKSIKNSKSSKTSKADLSAEATAASGQPSNKRNPSTTPGASISSNPEVLSNFFGALLNRGVKTDATQTKKDTSQIRKDAENELVKMKGPPNGESGRRGSGSNGSSGTPAGTS